MKMSLRALNPRSVRLSPAGAPPSPAVIVRPGTFRSTSRSVVAPCSSITVLGMTVIVCGVSRSGSVYFGDDGETRPNISTDAATPSNSSVTIFGPLKRYVTPLPASICASAFSTV
jgi:hypothetical protein